MVNINSTTVEPVKTPKTEEYDIRIRKDMTKIENSFRDEVFLRLQSFEKALLQQLEQKLSVEKSVQELTPLADGDIFMFNMEVLEPIQNIAIDFQRTLIADTFGNQYNTFKSYVAVNFNLAPDKIKFKNMLKQQQEYLRNVVTETTLDQANEIITRGIVDGKGYKEIAKDLKDRGLFNKARAEKIARTEANSTLNNSTREWIDSLGVTQYKISPAPNACDVCKLAAKDTYSVKEKVLPLHPNDRCVIISVIPDDWLKKTQEAHTRLEKSTNKIDVDELESIGRELGDKITLLLKSQAISQNEIAELATENLQHSLKNDSAINSIQNISKEINKLAKTVNVDTKNEITLLKSGQSEVRDILKEIKLAVPKKSIDFLTPSDVTALNKSLDSSLRKYIKSNIDKVDDKLTQQELDLQKYILEQIESLDFSVSASDIKDIDDYIDEKLKKIQIILQSTPQNNIAGATAFVDLTDVPSSYTGQAGKYPKVNATEDGLEFSTPSGSGDVTGDSASTDNAIARFDGITGKAIQNSNVTISDKGDMTLESTNAGGDNTSDSTNRINLNSYQRAEDPNNFGEVIRVYADDDRAKQMIAWYDRFTDPFNPQLKAWIGWHYLPNDIADPLHDHFSIETNDSSGIIRTRFEVMADNNDTTQVNTFNSNFTVIQGILGVTNADGSSKQLVIYTAGSYRDKSPRWSLSGDSTSESGSNVGTDFRIGRFNDDGSFIDTPFFIKRSTGYIQIGNNTTPSHSLTLASAGNGLAIHNQTDQLTNYERMVLSKATNVFTIYTENSGTGTQRNMRWGDSTEYLEVVPSASSGNPKFNLTRTTASSASVLYIGHAGMNLSSGSQYALQVNPTVTQSGTAGYNGILVNVVESSTGSGLKRLLNLQVGGTSKMFVANDGSATFTGDVTVPDEAYGAGWDGSLEVPTKNSVYDKIESMSAGSGITRSISTITTPTTAGDTPLTDYVYLVDNTTLTLPTAVGNTNRYTVKNVGTTDITIDTTSSQTIDGTTTIVIASEESVDLISNNTNWLII